MVKIKYLGNYSSIQVEAPDNIIYHLSKKIGWQTPGYKFTKAYKNYGWNGWTSYITGKGKAPYGCIEAIIGVIKRDFKETVFLDNELINEVYDYSFINDIDIKINKEQVLLRQHQKEAFIWAVQHNRSVLVLPTSAGKTLITYLLCKYYLMNNIKTLIIVPTVSLVDQGISDFYSYGYEGNINGIYSGKEKMSSDITFTTYQSLIKYSHLLKDYKALIIDEVHKAKANTLKKLIKMSDTIKFQHGLTGTLKSDSEEYFVASAFIGLPKIITTTSELIDKNIVAKLDVYIYRFLYKYIKDEERPSTYIGEKRFFNNNVARNDKILEIAINENRTGIIAVNEIEHCQYLFDRCRELYPDRNAYQIRGGVNQRNNENYKTLDELKSFIELEKNAILIVGLKVFSTGISLKNIYFGIMAVSTKSYVTIIQTIGRGLRVNSVKKDFKFIDILDDIRRDEFDESYSFNHYLERMKYYNEQKFNMIKQSFDITEGY